MDMLWNFKPYNIFSKGDNSLTDFSVSLAKVRYNMFYVLVIRVTIVNDYIFR